MKKGPLKRALKARIRRKWASIIFAVAAMVGASGGYMIANAAPAHAAAAPPCPGGWRIEILAPHLYVHYCPANRIVSHR